jgi:hypothetical protein
MFLTADELEALTGYKKKALQRRWLVDHGYRFDVRADGRAAVLASQVEARQGVAVGSKLAEPNWSILDDRTN